MKRRCLDPNHPAYHNYGGRGITVCPEWVESFESFWETMGPTWKKGLDIDRIDNSSGYSPSNCHWATRPVNSRNKRTSVVAGSLGLGGQERDRQVHPALSTPARSPSGRSGNCDAGYFAHVFDIVNCGPRRAFVARRPGGSVAVIAHNCVQATARDLLVTALKRLRDAGFEPILHVHDEIIVEVNSAEEADIVTRIMCENPPGPSPCRSAPSRTSLCSIVKDNNQ